MKLRLGARGSALSLAQANWVARFLAGRAEVDIMTIRTTGDRLSAAGSPIEWKGDFTKELDLALLEGRIDFAVHSLKDVPSSLPQGLELAAVPLREDPSDVLVSQPRRTFGELPPGARLGTSSPRRRAQLLAARPDLQISEARGNVDTRLRRLQEGKWDAIVLARAGLARLGRVSEVCDVFSTEILLPAVGQGALALISRTEDRSTREALSRIDHAGSHREVLAERSLLVTLQAGCHAPVAARARVAGTELTLEAGVFAKDGARVLRDSASGPVEEAESLGRGAAERLLARGAAKLLQETSP
ncbi:MAG TPA: hydroxymethylbilane synthase [Thermoanaerobaculia bacterium]|nr:hydroxymethylbilane synthase [Thermoanaerobaculia bacterium]